jgi:methyl-accepting chemotaxis protein
MNNQQLYDNNNEMINKQDEQLDAILNNVRKAKELNNDIGDEIEKQNPMLDNLHNGMQNVDKRMRKADTRLEALLKQQSYCCLYIIIGAELLVMVLLLLL